ncbi:hypothetical protein A8B78_08705 [Jannaschia sp. EhC01]|nr:hypothetical protein A8B78_08705 [Jannaschia sp. EhC01]
MTLTSRLSTATALVLCLTAPAFAETLMVTNFAPTGPGSLQAALDAAGASNVRSVILVTEADGTITTPTGLRYEGAAPVVIMGNGVTIASPNDVTLLTAIGPQVLAIFATQFTGPGGYSITDQGAAAGRGIFLDVAEDAAGVVSLVLTNVAVSGVAGHGIHVSDCTLAEACGGGEGGAGEGSDASIRVELNRVRIADVGQGSFDADGLRVDERGPGSIDLTGVNFQATGVGADGIELDEGQEGDVTVDMIRADFIENGTYCDPAVLEAYLPEQSEGEFREFEIAVVDLPQPSPDTPDMNCFELELDIFDDGSVEAYEYSIDVDDGLDIDEAGPGSIIATFSVGQMLANFDEGYDFDEAGPGDIDVVFTGIIANGNIDDAIKLSEAGPGSVYVTATTVEASSNGGIGIVAEEEDRGDLFMALISSATAGNDGGELGVEAVQDDEGVGNVYVIDSEIADGIETDGATIDAD